MAPEPLLGATQGQASHRPALTDACKPQSEGSVSVRERECGSALPKKVRGRYARLAERAEETESGDVKISIGDACHVHILTQDPAARKVAMERARKTAAISPRAWDQDRMFREAKQRAAHEGSREAAVRPAPSTPTRDSEACRVTKSPNAILPSANHERFHDVDKQDGSANNTVLPARSTNTLRPANIEDIPISALRNTLPASATSASSWLSPWCAVPSVLVAPPSQKLELDMPTSLLSLRPNATPTVNGPSASRSTIVETCQGPSANTANEYQDTRKMTKKQSRQAKRKNARKGEKISRPPAELGVRRSERHANIQPEGEGEGLDHTTGVQATQNRATQHSPIHDSRPATASTDTGSIVGESGNAAHAEGNFAQEHPSDLAKEIQALPNEPYCSTLGTLTHDELSRGAWKLLSGGQKYCFIHPDTGDWTMTVRNPRIDRYLGEQTKRQLAGARAKAARLPGQDATDESDDDDDYTSGDGDWTVPFVVDDSKLPTPLRSKLPKEDTHAVQQIAVRSGPHEPRVPATKNKQKETYSVRVARAMEDWPTSHAREPQEEDDEKLKMAIRQAIVDTMAAHAAEGRGEALQSSELNVHKTGTTASRTYTGALASHDVGEDCDEGSEGPCVFTGQRLVLRPCRPSHRGPAGTSAQAPQTPPQSEVLPIPTVPDDASPRIRRIAEQLIERLETVTAENGAARHRDSRRRRRRSNSEAPVPASDADRVSVHTPEGAHSSPADQGRTAGAGTAPAVDPFSPSAPPPDPVTTSHADFMRYHTRYAAHMDTVLARAAAVQASVMSSLTTTAAAAAAAARQRRPAPPVPDPETATLQDLTHFHEDTTTRVSNVLANLQRSMQAAREELARHR